MHVRKTKQYYWEVYVYASLSTNNHLAVRIVDLVLRNLEVELGNGSVSAFMSQEKSRTA